MEIKIQSIHFDADQKLLELIKEKVSRLDHFYEHIVSAEVFLKLERSDRHENKLAEIKIQIPGKILFAKEQNLSFEHAVEIAVDALLKQVKREKEKARRL